MFAGLPGIGVGTLFYVITALWMPIPECVRLLRGDSSLARWKRIGVQFSFAVSIIASIVLAERLLLWVLGAGTPGSLNPARVLNRGIVSMAPETILAAPIVVSMLLLGFVLSVVQIMHWAQRFSTFRAKRLLRRGALSEPYPPMVESQQPLTDLPPASVTRAV